ncbi:hypothetical protein K8I31_12295 [bacterium]|nr:hypothetical protein [bacterium]
MEFENIFPFLFIIVIIAILILAYIASQRRKKELRAWAESKGLGFNPSSNSSVDDNLPFRCLQRGHSRRGYNFISGRYGNYDIYVFDYRYTTGSGKNQQTHTLTVVGVDAAMPLQPLFIRRESFFDKMSEFVGFDDIDFEWKEFSDAFYVKSSNKKWAYDVINQKTMEYLMLAPKLEVEMADVMMVAWNDRVFTTSEIELAIDFLYGILNCFPDYLIQELKGKR